MKYHLGCGGDIKPGYVNVDAHSARAQVKADLLKMPYEPCDHIESHHVFEHFGYVDSLALLIKWVLALRKGGTLQIDVPDVQRLAMALGDNDKKSRGIMRLIFGSHEAGWAYHINGWTPTLLQNTVARFGMVYVSYRSYGGPESDFPHMGFEMVFRKAHVIEKKHLVQQGLEMLGEYTHPDEVVLRDQYLRQLGERI